MPLRGSSHSHMSISGEDILIYDGSQIDEETHEEIVKFCDKCIMTQFPLLDEDTELHNIVKEAQSHYRNHSKSCLKYHETLDRFEFPRSVARRTFICEPIEVDNDNDKQYTKKKKEKMLSWSDFDTLPTKYNWNYEDYECVLRVVHTRTVIIHKREPNGRWINQYNEELLRVWKANMDIQFVLDTYASEKYLMSYTTKSEREKSLLFEGIHKEYREGNMSVREEMKKLTDTFFNHRQVSVQEAIYSMTKMSPTYSS
ncbi:unnamed protein product [Rotaria sp. Silwood2]|nr:unnamed protein product [Rotaria sp. Silwood2]